MAIDITGEWWRGDASDDIADYLEELAPGGYPVHAVTPSRCKDCSGKVFRIELDAGGVCARRTCVACDLLAYMLDSNEYWMDGDEGEGPEKIACPCGSERFECTAGFSFRDGDAEVRWVSIGIRCVEDGILGCCADWQIRYGPGSRHLLDLA
ncbi:hypothetical protein GCM10023085_53820 [Actinomadura viridis]|uniref:Uncharacterized protein n=1 Tax=Actinomadura viridis TaxID=58110 RepID=A0A931GGH5_9ACTN|nr:hypothetical protein [Actinomadura viridis]MBG6086345.1 hypothetical protein [Actinomadura viridis]